MAGTDDDDVDRLAAIAMAALAVSIPLATTVVLAEAHPLAFDSSEITGIGLSDVALLVLLVVWVQRRGPQRLLLEGPRTQRILASVALAICTISFVAHPSSHGVEMLLRGVAAVATVDAAHRLRSEHARWFLVAFVGAGVAEALLAAAQSIHGAEFGIDVLEFGTRLFEFGADAAGQGGFFHPYLLATYLLAAIGATIVLRRDGTPAGRIFVAVAVLAFGVALTYSRSALLGCVAGLLGLVVLGLRDRRMWVVAAALCVGLGVGGLVGVDGWTSRGERTTSSTEVDSGRRDRTAEAFRLIERSPIVGVGIGRYQTELRETQDERPQHSHNPVLQLAAEAGVAAGALTAVLLVSGAVWTVRAGGAPTVIMLLSAPFWIVDAPGVVFPIGIAIASLWISVIVLAARSRSDGTTVHEPVPVGAHAPR